ncbi:hypothetical protein [Streptomyces shenzhenensis]|uniref:hypothetical protein n=1 Tax=Streptomyces shenzhenensis TaxID=943815 RepID=UPI001F479FBF|nr:hypothetical protein [Streptomyces shenzhenensis]
MEEQREVRFWRFEEDFGISLLIARLGTGLTPVAPDADADDARALRDDARLLLDSRLPAETLQTVWRAAAGQDPGPDVPGLLRRIVESAEDRIAREAAGLSSGDRFFEGTPLMITVDEPAMRKAVCAEVRAVAHRLTGPDVGAALERVAAEVDADLGFRLFLRVVKETPITVTMERYDRYLTIGEAFGYPGLVVHDGLGVRWPRFDDVSLRRRFYRDFGFSSLAGGFYSDLWQHSHTVDEGIRGAVFDYVGLVPGSSAYALLEDTLRLSRSPMSDDALIELWQAATCYGYDPRHEGAEARQWLDRIAEACVERLREIDPGFTIGAPSPGDFEAMNAVRRELREIAPVLTRAVHDTPWYGVTTSPWFEHSRTLVPALEQVVDQVDPDLGFRLLLRCVRVYDARITDEQYARWRVLGDRFGYGREHVAELADPHAER